MSNFFAPHKDFLNATLHLEEGSVEPLLLASGKLEHLGLGILRFSCLQPSKEKLVFSAGIHGNETGPIELLNQLVTEITSGHLIPETDCLLILGNPEAMRIKDRFINTNLNRLFKSGLQIDHKNHESRRAHLMMNITRAFLKSAKTSIHYDLHTTIRSSFYEKFAVYPFLPARTCPPEQLELMGLGDIEAVLLQNNSAFAFSAWTASQFSSESFTIELGSVAPLTQNALSRMSAIADVLRNLLRNQKPSGKPNKLPIQFQVVDEIIHQGESFELCIEDDVINFTELPTGFRVWRNAETEYLIGETSLMIVFPNAKAEPGQRAGLLVKPLSGMVLA